jgi:hypothetical protein
MNVSAMLQRCMSCFAVGGRRNAETTGRDTRFDVALELYMLAHGVMDRAQLL